MREYSRMVNAQAPPGPPPSPAAASGPAGPAAPAPQTPPGPSPQGPADELSMLIQTHGGLAIGALNASKPGYEFWENITELVGAGWVASICNYGEQRLADAMLQFPEFRMFGEMRVRQFAHEVVDAETYLENLEDHEGDESKHASKRAGA